MDGPGACGELREWELRGEDSINYLLSWYEEDEIDHLIHAGVCRIQEGIFKIRREFHYEGKEVSNGMMSRSSREGTCGLKGDLYHVSGYPKHASSSRAIILRV